MEKENKSMNEKEYSVKKFGEIAFIKVILILIISVGISNNFFAEFPDSFFGFIMWIVAAYGYYIFEKNSLEMLK